MPVTDRRRPAAAFVILFALYLCATMAGGPVLHSQMAQVGVDVAMLAAALLLARWLGFRGPEAYGLEWRTATPVMVVGGLVLALTLKYVSVCVGMALNVFVARPPETSPVAAVSFFTAIPLVALMTFIPSIASDVVARGFVLRALRVRWAPWTFVLVSAVVSVLVNAWPLGSSVAQWALLFCSGVAYATAAARTGSLWLAVGLHWGWNLANQLIGYVLPYEVVAPVWQPFLASMAHLVMLGLLFAVPVNSEKDGLTPDPA